MESCKQEICTGRRCPRCFGECVAEFEASTLPWSRGCAAVSRPGAYMHAAGHFSPQTVDGAHLKVYKPALCKAKPAVAPGSVPTIPALPKLPACKHFLNLTNGIEAVPLLESLNLSYR